MWSLMVISGAKQTVFSRESGDAGIDAGSTDHSKQPDLAIDTNRLLGLTMFVISGFS